MHGLLEIFKRGLMADGGQGDDEARKLRERMMLDTLRGTDAVPLGGQQVLRRIPWPPLDALANTSGALPQQEQPSQILQRTIPDPIVPSPSLPPEILTRSPAPIAPTSNPGMPTQILTRNPAPNAVSGNTYDPNAVLTRPRRVIEPPPEILTRSNSIPAENQGDPFGSSGDPFRISRLRRTQPRDFVADDAAYLRELERTPPKQVSRGKAALLGALSGLRYGLGGAAGGALAGAAMPQVFTRQRNDEEIAKAQDVLKRDVGLQGAQADIAYKGAQTQDILRRPEVDAAKSAEQERDNLLQAYNKQPYFNADKNPQHKAIADRAQQLGVVLPNRDEKDKWSLEWVDGRLERVNPDTGDVLPVMRRPGEQLTRQTDVPVVEGGLTVKPGEALGYRGTQENRDFTRGETQAKNVATKTAKANEASEFFNKAAANDENIKTLKGHITKLENGLATIPEFLTVPGQKDPDDPTKPLQYKNPEYPAKHAEFVRQIENLRGEASRLQSEADTWRGQSAAARAAADSIPDASVTRGTPRGSSPRRSRNYVAPKTSVQRLAELMQ